MLLLLIAKKNVVEKNRSCQNIMLVIRHRKQVPALWSQIVIQAALLWRLLETAFPFLCQHLEKTLSFACDLFVVVFISEVVKGSPIFFPLCHPENDSLLLWSHPRLLLITCDLIKGRPDINLHSILNLNSTVKRLRTCGEAAWSGRKL